MDVVNNMQPSKLINCAWASSFQSHFYLLLLKIGNPGLKRFPSLSSLQSIIGFPFQLPTASLCSVNYSSFSLQVERRLWIYLLVHFNIHVRPVSVQWALPGLLTLLSCFQKAPKSLNHVTQKHEWSPRPYIDACFFFVLLFHLLRVCLFIS